MASSSYPQVRVGLLWHSLNSANLGVGALTASNIEIVKQVAHEMHLEPVFTVLCMADSAEPMVLDANVAEYKINWRRLLSPREFFAEVSSLDCVLDIGLGDSFAEIYGFKRFSMLWLSKVLTAKSGTPLILAPQTVGPFRRAIYKLLARIGLNQAKHIVVRDSMSLRAAQQLKISPPITLSTDVAFCLPYNDLSFKRGGAARRIGVNVSGMLFNEATTARNSYGLSYNYARYIRNLLLSLVSLENVEIYIVPHVVGHNGTDDDILISQQLAREFPTVRLCEKFASPMDAKTFISSLDFLFAARMHACIGALSSGTPVYPVTYSRKFEGLFGTLGCQRLLPFIGLNDDRALALSMQALNESQAIFDEQEIGRLKIVELLNQYRSVLRTIFTEMAK